jgi:type II secretion system protein J
VASAILSLVLAALYGVFSRTLASKRLAEERATRARMARIVLLRIGEDLQAAFPPVTNHIRFIAETRRTGAFPEDSLSFVIDTHASLAGASLAGGLCEVSYTLEPHPQVPTRRQLLRRVSLDLSPDRGLPGDTYPLLSRVRGLRFRFFDGRTWREEWGQDKSTLPRAVEVVLYLVDLQEEVVQFATVIDLPLAERRQAHVS